MNNSRGILVLGGHVQALGIVRVFGREGLPVVVVDKLSTNIARHSRYCTAFHLVEGDALPGFLRHPDTVKAYSGWVVFPTNDAHVLLLSSHHNELSVHYLLAVDKWEAVSVFYNKRSTYRLAQELGVPIARTWFPRSVADLSAMDVEYPCIIKPAVMHTFYARLKRKVLFCRNQGELFQQYQAAVAVIPPDEVIVQEIIGGGGRNQFSACLLMLDGRVVDSLTANRLRQHPLDFGNATTYAELVKRPELVEQAARLLRAAGYNGLCEVEFKTDDRDGVVKFLEVNTRTWKWHMLAETAGVHFLRNYYCHLTGQPVAGGNQPRRASFVHLLTDIPVRLRLLLKGRKEALPLRKPLAHAVWDRFDWRPWLFEKGYLFHLIRTR